MKSKFRRNLVKFGLLGGITNVLNINHSIGEVVRIPTPSETEGPFYPVTEQEDKDYDLTKIDGHKTFAEGLHIFITGQITNVAGDPLEHAKIELWQANSRGRYRHPYDPNPQPLDPNFQGWAIINSEKNGIFRFKTIKPGAYPASKSWTRPPHLHFKITKSGYAPLITQMYFPGEKLNKTDLLLSNKTTQEQALMIAQDAGLEEGRTVYKYNITLAQNEVN